MKKLITVVLLLLSQLIAVAQFAPPAGQSGTTAMYKDSSAFIEWATACTVLRGYQDISDVSLGEATVGDSSFALGMAGINGVVSLGDGGSAIVTFNIPVSNGPGWDFAVFENGFNTFLELAFVEVSSDGLNYFRFPATSNTQDTIQVDGFGGIDATQIDNLAGKYTVDYGTPFDLQQLASQPGLNINAITHIKITDVIGALNDLYARHDQYGNKINDPWTTPYPSSGFDLDAVGVIHSVATGMESVADKIKLNVFPNPVKDKLHIQYYTDDVSTINIAINDLTGKLLVNSEGSFKTGWQNIQLNTSGLKQGMYLLSLKTNKGTVVKKINVVNE